MNFGANHISVTTTTNTYSNKTVTTSSLSTPISTTFSSDRTVSTFVPTKLETQNSSNTISNKNNYIATSSTSPAKSFTTPQNCLEILTSIQNNTIASNSSSAANFSSTSSEVISTHASSNAEINSLERFPSIRSINCGNSSVHMDGNEENSDEINICFYFERKLIWPEELTKQNNSSISENCSNIESTITSSTNSSLVNTVNFNQSGESLKIHTSENICSDIVESIELHVQTDELLPTDTKISINAANVLCDEDTLSKFSENSGEALQSTYSSDCIDRIKIASRLSERAKKKSWYNVLYPNYKSRSQDFRKLFRAVPNDERLIVDYSCALYRDLLIQGRLYISQNYVCFHANILGWETCLIIKWKDVTSITKEKTALVIPNAISICTPNEKFFFSSFTTRDKTFLILFRVWQNTLMNKPMPAQEIWQLVHNYYGDELGLTTDDEDYIDPTVEDQDESSSNSDFVSAIDDPKSLSGFEEEAVNRSITNIYQTVESSSGNSATSGYCSKFEAMKTNAKELTLISAKPEDGPTAKPKTQQTSATSGGSSSSSTVNPTALAFDSKRKLTKNNRQREENINKNSEILPTDISNSSDSEENSIPFVATAECNSPHEGRQLVHTILPINIETLFNLLFAKSKFLVDFHAMRKSTDLIFNEWITNENGQKTRTFNVTAQLAASVGPKTVKVTELQVMRDCSKSGELYSIDINTVNAGIPYADSFNVLVHYCLVKTVDDHTMLSVHAQIKYKKSVWGVVKGFIERNTWAGLDDFYTSLLHSLQSETCIPPAKGKGRRPRRVAAAQIRPTEEMPILQTKPEPAEFCSTGQTISTRHLAEDTVIAGETTIKFRWLSLFVLVLLCFLIIVNIMLLLKLWKLEERIEEDLSARAHMPNLSALKQLPNNHEDWIELLRQQEVLHETELKKWHTVLQTAIQLLKKTERTLAELMFR